MVEIHDLHVRFHGASREAVAGIDLTICDGEVVGLVGESGSGKTVTAMTLSGLIERKKVTLSGEVRFDGRDILRLPRAELRAIQGRELGVVFQEPMTAMDPLMRIGPQVEEALAVHTQLTKEQRRARALEALRDVDLPAPEEIYRKYPHECSGGQLQRVIAAAGLERGCDLRRRRAVADHRTRRDRAGADPRAFAPFESGARHLDAAHLAQFAGRASHLLARCRDAARSHR